MRSYFTGRIITIAIAVAGVSSVISVFIEPARAQGSAVPDAATSTLRTAWGEPDLQGIWTDETYTPLQRPAVYGDREMFTEAQRAELDRVRAALAGKNKRAERGTELDVGGSYNDVFMSRKRTGARTSLIVDPPNGRRPSLTAEAQKLAAADREFRLALLQSTETCKNKLPACNGGNYDPTPSPRRLEPPPRYDATNGAFINRHDGPEDGHLSQRCLNSGLPEFGTAFGGSFRRIVQTPGGISMFYDFGQGQGFQRSSLWTGALTCRPASASGLAIRVATGRGIRW
jgi:hypothetical protein